jgi:hypothetical protein
MDFSKSYVFFLNSGKIISAKTEKIHRSITKPVYLILVELTHLRIKSNIINPMVLNSDFRQLMFDAIDFSIHS